MDLAAAETKKGPVLLKFPKPVENEDLTSPEQLLRAALKISGRIDEVVILVKDIEGKYCWFGTTEAGGYAGLVHFIEKVKAKILEDEFKEETVDTKPPKGVA